MSEFNTTPQHLNPWVHRRTLIHAVASVGTWVAVGISIGVQAQQGAPQALRIAHQKGPLSVLKARGTLEKAAGTAGLESQQD